MAKARIAYVCNECGAEFSKWQGQCTECNAWNSLSEIVLESAAAAKAPASRRAGWAGKIDPPKVTALKDVEQTEHRRVTTGIGEFSEIVLNDDQVKEFQKYLICIALLSLKMVFSC